MKSCLIIAGEKSGEEHALSFFSELRSNLPGTEFFGVGGNELEEQGLKLIYHLNDFSTWGITQAIAKLPFYKKALKDILNEVDQRNCKTAILIDYQTFNLKLARDLKKRGVRVLYYVAPQAWAWKEWRVKPLEEAVDTLFSIIPFEKKWFEARGVSKVITVEHPLLKHYKNALVGFERKTKLPSKTINLLLLPGSRNFEVQFLLPEFIKTVEKLRVEYNLRVSIVKSSSIGVDNFTSYEDKFDKVYSNEELITALKEADVALASSGTVNLACALFQLPTVVGYTTNLFNKFIYETFVSYSGYISLTNIVHESEVFPEFIGESATAFNFTKALRKILDEKEYTNSVQKLSETQKIISGEDISVSQYMIEKIRESYED